MNITEISTLDLTKQVLSYTVESTPMKREDYSNLRGWTLPVDENRDDDGFLILRLSKSGEEPTVTWTPAETYKAQCCDMRPFITPTEVDEFLARLEPRFDLLHDSTKTVCSLVYGTFIFASGDSACLDPSRYSKEVGEKEALKAAIINATSKAWEQLGFERYKLLHSCGLI